MDFKIPHCYRRKRFYYYIYTATGENQYVYGILPQELVLQREKISSPYKVYVETMLFNLYTSTN